VHSRTQVLKHLSAQMNFCNRYEFHFLAKLFVVSQRSKVIDNVKHLSIGLLSVYGCFVVNRNKFCYICCRSIVVHQSLNFIVVRRNLIMVH